LSSIGIENRSFDNPIIDRSFVDENLDVFSRTKVKSAISYDSIQTMLAIGEVNSQKLFFSVFLVYIGYPLYHI
jgi:hypothetical protein